MGNHSLIVVMNGRKYSYKGQSKTLREWADSLGVPLATLRTRLRRNPGDIAQCLTNDSCRDKTLNHLGMRKNLAGWAEYYGVHKSTFCDMYKKLGKKRIFQWYDNPPERRRVLHEKRRLLTLRRRNRVYTIGSRKMTFREMVGRSGLSYSTIRKRIKLLGWDLEKAVSTPAQWHRVLIDLNGHTMLLRDVSLISGVPVQRLRNRLRDRHHTGLGILTGKLLDNRDLRESVIEYDGDSKSIREWSRELCMPYGMLWSRIRVRGKDDKSVFNDPRSGSRLSEQRKLEQELASLGVIF